MAFYIISSLTMALPPKKNDSPTTPMPREVLEDGLPGIQPSTLEEKDKDEMDAVPQWVSTKGDEKREIWKVGFGGQESQENRKGEEKS